MVAITPSFSQPKVRIPKKRMLTYDDYARMTPPDNGNYELHNGKLIFMPTPTPQHQRASMRLSFILFNYISTNKLGEVFTAPMDTVFSKFDTLQPDLLFLSNERLHLIGDKKIEGAPDLVVEILSPSNSPKEMSFKKFVYEVTEVREYWVVNVEKQTLTQYEKIENEFHIRKIYQANETLKSIVLEGFEIEIASIFN